MKTNQANSQPQLPSFQGYRTIRWLGSGGFSEVYLVEKENSPGDFYAAKQIKQEIVSQDPDKYRERFQREAQLQIGLHQPRRHPHIVKIYEYDEQHISLVMEYANEGTLDQLLHDAFPRGMDLQTALSVVTQVGFALAYMHEKTDQQRGGIVHLDLKPKNILVQSVLTAEGRTERRYLVADFSLAHELLPTGQPQGGSSLFAGTVRYMSPEQAAQGGAGTPGPQADIYALGVILHQMLSGRLPLPGVPPPPLREQNKAIPAEVEMVVQRATAKNPEERYGSMRGFIKDLTQAVEKGGQIRPAASGLSSVSLPFSTSSSSGLHFLSHALTSLLTLLLTLLVVFFVVRLPLGFLPSQTQARSPGPSQSSACRLGQTVFSQSTNVIKIGVDLPLSGDDIHDGQPVLNAIELAIAKNSISSGYTLELYICDNVSPRTHIHDGGNGANNIRTLAADAQVAAIIGPFNSDVAIDELPVASQNGIALMSPSTTSTCLTAHSPADFCNTTYQKLHPNQSVTFFRTAALDSTEGTYLADYLVQQGYLTAYVIEDAGTYGQDLALAFRNEWFIKTSTQPEVKMIPASGSTPNYYQSAISQINPTDPKHSVIFYAGNTPNATLIYALIEQNTRLQGIPFAAGAGIINASFATDIGGSKQSGPIYAVAPVGRSNSQDIPGNLDFYTSYLSSYNDQPTPYSASAYDCVKILIQAINEVLAGTLPNIPALMPPGGSGNSTQARDFRQEVLQALMKTSMDGITDHYIFTPTGDTCNQTVSLYQRDMTSQRWEYIQTALAHPKEC